MRLQLLTGAHRRRRVATVTPATVSLSVVVVTVVHWMIAAGVGGAGRIGPPSMVTGRRPTGGRLWRGPFHRMV